MNRKLKMAAAISVALAVMLTGCSKSEYPNNTSKKRPDEYIRPAQQAGEIVEFTYVTKRYLTDESEYEKKAYVYLPYGYDQSDESTEYDVFYLMHGGAVNEGLFFIWGAEDGRTETQNLLDNMIANREMKPCIVCTPTFNIDGAADETESCLNYYKELVNDLIPALEMAYNTHLKSADPEAIRQTRDHRAFGGFSMGAVTTWSVFEHCMDAFRYYMPMCGDCWTIRQSGGGFAPVPTSNKLRDSVLEAGYTADDFRLFIATGTEDMARRGLTYQVEAMKKLDDMFIYCKNFSKGNMYYCILDGGGHDFPTVHTAIRNGLPMFFH